MTKFVDTNILVRLITRDVPALAEEALNSVEAHGSGELVIADSVLVELFFVLENNQQYMWKRAEITSRFQDIIDASQFEISTIALDAFKFYEKHPKLDFTDCLLAVLAEYDKTKLLNFDKDLLSTLA